MCRNYFCSYLQLNVSVYIIICQVSRENYNSPNSRLNKDIFHLTSNFTQVVQNASIFSEMIKKNLVFCKKILQNPSKLVPQTILCKSSTLSYRSISKHVLVKIENSNTSLQVMTMQNAKNWYSGSEECYGTDSYVFTHYMRSLCTR